jgi:flagellar FliL protein
MADENENQEQPQAAPAAAPGGAPAEGADDAAAAAAAKAKKKKKLIIFGAIGAVVIIGAVVGYMMYSKSAHEKALAQAELEQTPEYKLQQQLKFKKENKPPKFIKMDEFTVNLPGRGGEHYLQASLVLRTADGSTEGRVKDFLPIVRDRVILVLASRTMQELATVEGKNAMAREIALVINAIIEPQLTAIFILQQQPGTADLQNLARIGAMPQSTTAGEKLSQTAVQAAAQFWKVSEMDLPVQQVLFDKFVMQ